MLRRKLSNKSLKTLLNRYDVDAMTGDTINQKSGKVVGSYNSGDYLRVRVNLPEQQWMMSIQLNYILMTGKQMPLHLEGDHCSGVRDDNSWVNCEPVTRSENMLRAYERKRDELKKKKS